jgi:hypothetical protein
MGRGLPMQRVRLGMVVGARMASGDLLTVTTAASVPHDDPPAKGNNRAHRLDYELEP